MLYNHIAEDYGNLFISLGVGDAGQQDANKSLGGGTGSKAAYDPRAFLRKDRILEWYPDLCSQVIYSVCTTLFARATMTKMSLGQEFKEHLLRQLHTWLSGVPPTTVTLKHWPAHYLNPIDLNAQVPPRWPIPSHVPGPLRVSPRAVLKDPVFSTKGGP